jgi:hypothetical protein
VEPGRALEHWRQAEQEVWARASEVSQGGRLALS